jgi:hypothetical protein
MCIYAGQPYSVGAELNGKVCGFIGFSSDESAPQWKSIPGRPAVPSTK